jgi:hypothetical protein
MAFRLLPGLLLAVAAAAQEDLQALVRALTAEDFEAREAATQELIARGPGARDALLLARPSVPLEAQLRIDAILADLGTLRRRHKPGLPATLVTLELDGVPITSALERLGRAGGTTLRLRAADGREPTGQRGEERRIDLHVTGIPWLEALDRLCEQASLFAARDYQTGEILLHPGVVQPGRCAYSGPFRLALTHFSITRATQFQGPPTSMAHLQVSLDVESRAPVLGILVPLAIPVVRDDLGNSVAFVTGGRPAGMQPIDRPRQLHFGVALEVPDPRARALLDLRIPVDAVVPEESLVAEAPILGAPAPGARLRVDHVLESEAETQIILSFRPEPVSGEPPLPAPPAAEEFVVLAADGTALPLLQVRPGQPHEGREVRTLALPPGVAPALVRGTWLLRYRVERVEFAFAEIPIP